MTETLAQISAGDVNKLRQKTGAGMMDCKKALAEANGDFEQAIVVLRKKGTKVSANRADKEAKEGVVIAQTEAKHTKGCIIELNCETDFVAKNSDYIQFAKSIIEEALSSNCSSIEEVKNLQINGVSIQDRLNEKMAVIGEKIELTKFIIIKGDYIIAYNHPGNKLAVLVSFNKSNLPILEEVGRDIAMQIAAMNPLSIDKNDIDKKIVEREIEIGKDLARQEGKPEQLLEKIALGKLNKFYKENTLNSQDFVKDNSKIVSQVLTEIDKDLKVITFKRVALGN